MKEPYPPFIGSKLASLAEHAQQMQGYAQQPITQANNLRQQLGEVKYALASPNLFQQIPVVDTGSDKPLGVDPDRLAHLKTEATKLEAAIEACVAEHKRRHELHITAQHCVNIARHWLERLPDNTLLSPAPPVKLDNGNHRHTLDVVRRELADTTARIKSVQGAIIPYDDLVKSAERWVREKAASQRLVVQAGPGSFEVIHTKSKGHPFDHAAPDPINLLCRLFPEDMQALLLEGAGAAPGMDGALSDAERDAKLAELSAKATALERQEEALVMALLDAGTATISRRRDASPAVLLGAVLGTLAAKQAVAA